jgi:MFS transporter, PPP family, 3-phenylpropionic acid transporter
MNSTFSAHPANRATTLSAISLFAGIFVLTGTHLPYFPLWLDHEGYSESQIALILGLPMFLRIIALPLLTALADRFGLLLMLGVCYAGATLACLGFLVFQGFAATLFFAAALGFMLAPTAALADSIIGLTAQSRKGLVYGQVRGVGSIFFMATNLAVGFALPHMAPDMIIVIMMMAGLAATFALWPASAHLVNSSRRMAPRPMGLPVQQSGWLLLAAIMLASALIQSSHAYLYAFGSIEWRRQGISDGAMGIAWSTGVLAEIVFFYVLGSRIKCAQMAAWLIVLGGIGAVIRWCIYAQALPKELWPLVQMLHAVSFAMTYLGAVTLINALSPERRRAFAQGLLGGATGAAMAVVTLFSDDLYVAFKAQGYYGAALLAFCGVCVALYPLKALQPHKAGTGGNTVPPS